jgi:hypothetical protein
MGNKADVCECKEPATCPNRKTKLHLCQNNDKDHDIDRCGSRRIHQCLHIGGCNQYLGWNHYDTYGQYCKEHSPQAPECKVCKKKRPGLRKTDGVCWNCAVGYCKNCSKLFSPLVTEWCHDCLMECNGKCGWKTRSTGEIWAHVHLPPDPKACVFHGMQRCQGVRVELSQRGIPDNYIVRDWCLTLLPFPGLGICKRCVEQSELRQMLIDQLQACQDAIHKKSL